MSSCSAIPLSGCGRKSQESGMSEYLELEIRIHPLYGDSYPVELRFADGEQDQDLTPGNAAPVQIDPAQLRALSASDAAYGRALTATLFIDWVKQGFQTARLLAAVKNTALRVRLSIASGAAELHNLRWETLRDPEDDAKWLLTSERVLFSRYLSSDDWRWVQSRARTALKALLIISNPTDLGDYRVDDKPLAPIDVAAERERATLALQGTHVDDLASDLEMGSQPTLDNLTDRLRDVYDIIYVVCHGAVRPEPWILLCKATGEGQYVTARQLTARLRDTAQVPRLVVLASCQSAGTGDVAAPNGDGVLAALGPEIAKAGVPAVVAMQGDVSMETVEQFMPVFFSELQRDGQIDRALAAARAVIERRPDKWLPALFMRVRSGRLWYEPGFNQSRPGSFGRWEPLVDAILANKCTPILGPALGDTLLGSRREIAYRWAEEYHFPLKLQGREDLPQVAQFVATNKGSQLFVRRQLPRYVAKDLVDRYGKHLSTDLLRRYKDNPESVPAIDVIAQIWDALRADDSSDPYYILARLPFPLYITANPITVLPHALERAGKTPHMLISPWYDDPMAEYQDLPDGFRPDVLNPVVYQAFGDASVEGSLVITEDDYFDYLIGITERGGTLPAFINRAKASTALLFLGFQTNDWSFRALLRNIMSQKGGDARRSFTHVAVQVEPEDSDRSNVERAREYLESYFDKAGSISVYWGNVEDFVKELASQDSIKRVLAAAEARAANVG
jgi:hypothetical protein